MKNNDFFRWLRIVSCLLLLTVLIGCGGDSSNDSRLPAQFTAVAFPQSAAEIEAETQAMMTRLTEGFQEIIDAKPRAFENTIVANDYLSYQGYRYYVILGKLKSISPSQEIRDAAMSAISQLAQYITEVRVNQQLQAALDSFSWTEDEYSGEELLLIQATVSDSDLSEEERVEIGQLQIQISLLTEEFTYYLQQGLYSASVDAFTDLLYTHALYANLSGVESAAGLYLEPTMAQAPEVAKDFVRTISAQLDGSFQFLLDQLTKIKVSDTGDSNAEVNQSDIHDYFDEWVAAHYQISNFSNFYLYGEMFPLENILQALFTISERVFGIHLEQAISPTVPWADDVTYFEATDTDTGEPVASLYLDIYDRDGKETAYRLTQIAAPYTLNDVRMRPVHILQANFPEPSDESRVMLSWYQTESLFHEFGHFLNYACGNSTYYLTKVSLRTDYIELMSQLLEKWMIDLEVIDILQENSPLLSDDEFTKFLRAKRFFDLIEQKHTIAQSMFGLSIYDDYSTGDIADSAFDPLAIYNDTIEEYYLRSLYRSATITSHHGTYPALYYGYLWSDVIAEDISSVFRQTENGFMNRQLGKQLKEIIYTNPYDYDATTDIEYFLGRPWHSDAFLNYYDLQ